MKPLFQLTRSSMIWLLVSILLVMAPFSTVVPAWLFLLALLTVAWRLMVHSGRWSFPHWSVRIGLLLLVLIGLLLELRAGSVMVVTVGLLLAAFLLKLMEMYQRRDALVVLFVAFLLIACSFLFFQSIPMALYSLLSLIVVTACLNTVYRSQQNNDIWRPLKRSAVLYLQALPMMLVLFLIFPRIGPLWQVDTNTGQSFTGLSDSMSPGDVSRLTRSAEIAFRARFDGPLPPEDQRYWRGLTYDRFDGRRWTRSSDPAGRHDVPGGGSIQLLNGPEYRYQMTMEATGQHWRYALDVPLSYPAFMRRMSDMTLQGKDPLMQRTQYPLSSRLGRVKDPLSGARLSDYWQLPSQGNEKARQLALQWKTQSRNAHDFSLKMLNFFATDFRYTLEPPLLMQNHPIDQFLFDTRQGFCGHFASAGAFMFRAAGIPARVVGGYLGGELNPLDEVLTVRQYEAHAWLEYWDKESSTWQRLDPTSVVAPLRLAQPAAQMFSNEPAFLADSMLMRNGFLSGALLKQLRLRYEAINYSWHRWVLNFHDRQTGFLQQLLGKISAVKVILLLLVPGGLVLLAVAGSLFIRRGARKDPLQKALQQLDKRLQPEGLERQNGETAGHFFSRLALSYPSLSDEFSALSGYYEQIRYAENADPHLQQRFARIVTRCCASMAQLKPA